MQFERVIKQPSSKTKKALLLSSHSVSEIKGNVISHTGGGIHEESAMGMLVGGLCESDLRMLQLIPASLKSIIKEEKTWRHSRISPAFKGPYFEVFSGYDEEGLPIGCSRLKDNSAVEVRPLGVAASKIGQKVVDKLALLT